MADYFELGDMFGQAYKPSVRAAEAAAEGVGRSAETDVKWKNRKALIDTLLNLSIIGLEGWEGHKESKKIAKYAKDEEYKGSYSFWGNLFSDPEYTRGGKTYTEEDISTRKKFGIEDTQFDFDTKGVDVRKILGVPIERDVPYKSKKLFEDGDLFA